MNIIEGIYDDNKLKHQYSHSDQRWNILTDNGENMDSHSTEYTLLSFCKENVECLLITHLFRRTNRYTGRAIETADVVELEKKAQIAGM